MSIQLKKHPPKKKKERERERKKSSPLREVDTNEIVYDGMLKALLFDDFSGIGVSFVTLKMTTTCIINT